MRFNVVYGARLLALGFALLPAAALRAVDSLPVHDNLVQDAVRALDSFDAWLGGGNEASGWRSYLQTAELRSALNDNHRLVPSRDRQAVFTAVQRLTAINPAVDQPQFTRLRHALEDVLDQRFAPGADELPDLVRSPAAGFRFYSPAEIMDAQTQLRQSAERLNAYLARLGPNGQNWKSYLLWSDLEQQLSAGAEFDPARLELVVRRFRSADDARTMAAFYDVEQTLAQYLHRGLMPDSAATVAEAEATRQGLATALQGYFREPTDEGLTEISRGVHWFAQRDQRPDIVWAVRRRLAQPNLQLQVSARFLDAGLTQAIDQPTAVRDRILGTSISGSARTRGRIRLHLAPDPDRALLELVFGGALNSKTVGRNGPVQVYSRGTTIVHSRKRLVFDAHGLRALPTEAQATTKSSTTGLSTNVPRLLDPLVRKIAVKQLRQKKGQADRIAARHAKEQFVEQFDTEAGRQFEPINRQFVEQVRRPLLAAGDFPDVLRFRSTTDYLHLTALQANAGQLAAHAPPAAISVAPDLALRLHESTVNNVAASRLSGRTLENEEVQAELTELLGKLPAELEDDDDEPWSITFADTRPVHVKIANNTFSITVRGAAFTSGDGRYGAMDIATDYQIEQQGTRLIARRPDELRIFPPDFASGSGQRLGVRQQVLRRLLQKRFGKLLQQEMRLESPLNLPDQWSDAGPLTLTQFSSGAGWLILAWTKGASPASLTLAAGR